LILRSPWKYDSIETALTPFTKDRGEQFTHKLNEIISTMRAGGPLDSSTTLTPIASERSLKALLAQLETAVTAGAKMVVGEKRIKRAGYYVKATIVTNITPDNLIVLLENFGPIASAYVIDTEEEAIEWANSTNLGLCASVRQRWYLSIGRNIPVRMARLVE
jgi:succinate-semialdehyde dehydrogenase/glutarate-semialdehyde dehydrogenase